MNEMKKDGGDSGSVGGGGTVIDASVTPSTVGASGVGYYGIGANQITVAKLEGTGANGVPTGYIRYDHKPADGNNFTLGSVKHNDFSLDGIPTGTQNVQAVYVYYSTGDSRHEFPLIVCVKIDQNKRTYYKRGQRWSDAGPTLNGQDPEGQNAATQLNSHLDGLKNKYEIKLENQNGYKARPGTDTITVTAVNPQAGINFKGYRHQIPNTTDRVNRITIHGHVITDIPQTVLDGFTFDTNGGVYVYFPLSGSGNPELEKPLLICLSPTGGAGSGNVWYKRNYNQKTRENSWTNVTSQGYENIKPVDTSTNTIDPQLVPKLAIINTALKNAGDEGYKKPDYILKLDYVSKSDSATNEYDQKITGDTGLTDGDDVTVIANAIKAFNRPIDPQSITSGIEELKKKNDAEAKKIKKNIIIGAAVSVVSFDILLIISISSFMYISVNFDLGAPDYVKPKAFAIISGIFTASFIFTPVLIANQIEKTVLKSIEKESNGGTAKLPDDKTKALIDLARLVCIVGIAISSAIAVFVLQGQGAAKEEAKNCSCILLSFLWILIINLVILRGR